MFKTLALQQAQKAVNTLLQQSDNYQDVMKPLHHKTIAVEVTDLSIKVLTEFEHGQVFFIDTPVAADKKIHVTLSGTSQDFVQTAINQSQGKSIEGLTFSGEIATGQHLQQLAEQLTFDWEARLAQLSNDYIAYHAFKVIKHLNSWLKQTLDNKLHTSKEVLTEEWRLTPSHYEIEHFIHKVQQTQWSLDRLEAKLKRAERS